MKYKSRQFFSLLAIFVCITLGGMVIFLHNSYLHAVESFHQQHQYNQELIIKQVIRRAKHHYTHSVDELIFLAENPVIKRLDSMVTEELLQKKLTHLKHFNADDIGILDEKGTLRFIAVASHLKGKDFSSTNYFLNAKNSKKVEPICEIVNFEGMTTEQTGIIISMPFFSDIETFKGVVFISIKLDEMFALPASKETCDSFYLLGDKDRVVLSSTGKHEASITDCPIALQGIILFLAEMAGVEMFSGEYNYDDVEMVASGTSLKMDSKTLKLVAVIPTEHISVLSTRFSHYYATGILMVFLGLLGTYLMLFHWHIKLRSEVKVRRKIETELQKSHETLEKRVQDRTNELSNVNKQLRKQIIQRKDAMERIHKQNEFLNHIMESLTIPFYVIDINDYTVKLANSASNFGPLPASAKNTHAQLKR
jgi:C4-dicarboxylate-specific signal transduction histidine kinase